MKEDLMFIVIEGIDGCGKDTQIELLKKKFDFRHFKYPTNKFSILRNYLDKKVSLDKKGLFLLFLADIADEQPEVANAKSAIADRYIYSTLAYELGAFDFEKSKKIIEDIGYIKPDLVILLDVSPETVQKRKAAQKQLDRYESDLSYLRQVRERFLKLAASSFHAKRWAVINAEDSVENVNKAMDAHISKIL
jgi:dTMP kinase